MIAVSPAAVAGCGALSAFLIVFSAFPARSPMAARIKKLERVSEKSVAQRITIIDQIVSKERTSRLQQRLIEAGWYGVTPLAMTLRTIGAIGIGAVTALMIMLFFPIKALALVIGGFVALIGFHILCNLGMVVGLMPIMGIPLPLMSSGGTAVISMFIGVGLALSVRRRRFVN